MSRRVFMMTFAAAEFDMVIFSDKTNSCECYEIKNSDQIVERQTQYLTDEECLKATEWRFGPITKRCVIYREPDAVLESGIVYRDIENYLWAL